MTIANNITELIGNTPLVRLNRVSESCVATIVGKCEFMNPSSSVKDRAGLAMIESAERDGKINKDTVIIEPTSGNTGIAISCICAVKGYKVILTMPDSMSLERRNLLKAFGAELILTPGHLGMSGAIEEAEKKVQEIGNAFMPQQFNNEANPVTHEQTTAKEILKDTNGNIDIFVAGVGTGGTLSGVGKILKEHNPNIKIIALEPHDSAVISGEKPGPHMIQGIGAGFIPGNLNTEIIDEVIKVTNEDAVEMARRLAKKEGILVGISAGANVHGAVEIGRRSENKNKTIVTILCDFGERYLSTTLFK